MNKPLNTLTFRKVGECWRRVDSQEPCPPTLADVLKDFDLEIDYKTEFARIKDYDNQLEFYYRAYGGVITLEIWQIEKVR